MIVKQRTAIRSRNLFSEEEMLYLIRRSLARLAFIASDNHARIMPVLFTFDGSTLHLSGWNLRYSQRFNEIPRSQSVTLLVDDLDQSSGDRWVPRGIEIVGEAETIKDDEHLYVTVTPVEKTSWGI